MFKAEVCIHHAYQDWNTDIVGTLSFHNFARCATFARNYTRQNNNMVRIYIDNSWVMSYRFGKEIWNAF